MVYKKRLKAIKEAVEKVRKDVNIHAYQSAKNPDSNDFANMVKFVGLYERFFSEVVNELEGLKL